LVAAHRGDVVKFAGDALLVFWPADADLAAATARAACCGLALQGFLDATELAADECLTMRVGIGAGQVFAAHLGGERGRWEFVVGGPAVAQSCMAEDLAQPGEVVLSGEALAKAREVVTGDQVPAGGAGAVALRVTAVKYSPRVG
jgi:class 3 adenylate cyclase